MNDIKLEVLLDKTYCATEEEINPIISAITERFTEIYPEWELMSLSIHGHDQESRLESLRKSIDVIKNIGK